MVSSRRVCFDKILDILIRNAIGTREDFLNCEAPEGLDLAESADELDRLRKELKIYVSRRHQQVEHYPSRTVRYQTLPRSSEGRFPVDREGWWT